MIVIVLAGIVGALIATAVLVLGIRGRTIEREPHCPKCQYYLAGLRSDNCPECGVPISMDTIQTGRRKRRPWLIGLGLAGLFGSLTFTGLGALGLEAASTLNDMFTNCEGVLTTELLDQAADGDTVALGCLTGRAWQGQVKGAQAEELFSLYFKLASAGDGFALESLEVLCCTDTRASSGDSWFRTSECTTKASRLALQRFDEAKENGAVDQAAAWAGFALCLHGSDRASTASSNASDIEAVAAWVFGEYEASIAETGSISPTPWCELVWSSLDCGLLNSAQMEVVFSREAIAEVRMRERVAEGDLVPIEIDIVDCVVAGVGGGVGFGVERVSVGGKTLQAEVSTEMYEFSWLFSTEGLKPGKYDCSIDIGFEQGGATPHGWSTTQTFTFPLVVVDGIETEDASR